ncbi:MAG: translocation/assembly module TamB domain-containing protein, partial [Gemmatimonadetes bacterium]|nr:translocation/assembly module TamB domain-containing protein [Gemmatimonadota bacterium]
TDTRAPKTPVPLKASGTFDLSVKGKTGFTKLVVEAPRLEAPFIAALAPKAGLARGVAGLSATIDAKGDSMWVSGLRAVYDRAKVGQSLITGRVALHRGPKGVDGYDARLRADSLRLTTILRDSSVARVGALAGTINARGDDEQVTIKAELGGPAGAISSDVAVHFAPGRTIAGTVAVHDVVVRLAQGGAPISLDAHSTIDLKGDSLPVLTGNVAVDIDSTTIGAAHLSAGVARVRFASAHAYVDTLALDAGVMRFTGRGGLGLARGVSDTLRLALVAGNLDALRNAVRPLFGRRRPSDSTTFARFMWDDTVRGAFDASTVISGRADSADARALAALRALHVGAFRTDSATLAAALLLKRDTLTGTADLALGRAQVAGQPLDRARVHGEAFGPGRYGLTWDGQANKGFDRLSGHALAGVTGDTIAFTIDSVFAHFGVDTLRLSAPTRFWTAPGLIALDSTQATLGQGGRLFMAGRLTDSAEATGVLQLDDFPLVIQDSATQVPPRVRALVNARAGLSGTRKAPRFEALVDAADVKLFGTAAGAARVTGEYVKKRLSATASIDEGADGSLVFAGDLPVDLSLVTVEKRLTDEPIVGTLRSDSLKLGFLKKLVPSFSEIGGTLRADVNVGGRPERLLLDGHVAVDAGQFVSSDVGLQLRDVVANVVIRNDTLTIERFRAKGEKRGGDSLTLSGYAFLPDTGLGAIDLRLRANQYAAFRNRSLGAFDVNGELHLYGTRDAATLDGDAEVYDAVGYIGAKFSRQVEESRLVVDEPDEADSTIGPAPPKAPSFTERLRERVAIGDLSLRLGDNVRLRSGDANIVLGGAIRASGRLDAINLGGDLIAKRGIYRLNLGLATRTFQVDSGRVTFFGPLENSPALDITTTYVVRLETREQVKIHASILGTAATPRIVLSSDDQATTGSSDTELLSYLIFGVPSFALSGQNASSLRSVQNALAPTL